MSSKRMFMWAWQETFQGGLRGLAEGTLGRLVTGLTPNVFVLGIRDHGDNSSICFEPEDCGHEAHEFAGVRSHADALLGADPCRDLVLGAPHLHERHKASLLPKAIRKAVLEALATENATRGMVAFCSFPVLIDSYWVMGVIELAGDVYDRLPALKREFTPDDDLRRLRMTTSLQDGVVACVLTEGCAELTSASRGENVLFGNVDRVLEDAGRSLTNCCAYRAGLRGADVWWMANEISASRYENEQCNGRLLLAAQSHPCVASAVRFATPVPLGNRRAIRKLLETTRAHSALLAGADGIWGLGDSIETYDGTAEDLFELRFPSHYTWELIHGTDRLVTVKYRQPTIPKPRVDDALVRDHAERLFPQQPKGAADRLVLAAHEASTQRHGTMLVVSEQAESEAHRLARESMAVDPVDLTPELVSCISAVDGAMLVSPDMRLHAFGAILDGSASKHGNSARGARFNSAIRYADEWSAKGVPVLILIVSEDGYIDLYPQLPPRIRRSAIDDALARLERAIGTDGPLDVSPVWDAMNYLDRHRMYLRPDDVARANAVKTVLVDRATAEREAEVAGTLMIPLPVRVADFEIVDHIVGSLYLPEPGPAEAADHQARE